MQQGDPSLKKYLQLSLLVHGILVALLILSPGFFSKKKPFKKEKITWIRIPKGLDDKIGVGVKKTKGLPKTTIAEAKKPLSVPPPSKQKPSKKVKPKQEPDPKPVTGPHLPVTKKVKPKPRPQRRQLSAAERALARVRKSANSRPPEAAQVPDDMAEGGVPFGSDTGPFVSPNDPIYVLYQAKIRKRIMDAWVLPLSFAQGERYTCQIMVKINAQGKVIRTEFEQRSGSEPFDQSAFRAIHKASPLDIPPEKLKREAINEGFIIEFDPSAKG